MRVYLSQTIKQKILTAIDEAAAIRRYNHYTVDSVFLNDEEWDSARKYWPEAADINNPLHACMRVRVGSTYVKLMRMRPNL